MNYEQIRAKIQVPPESQSAFQRGLVAAMKIMFDKERGMLDRYLDENEGKSLGEVAGGAAAGTVGYVFSVSNGQIPMDLTLPLGVEVVLHIFEYLEQTGEAEPTAEDFGQAMSVMTAKVLSGAKGDTVQQGRPQGAQSAPPQGLIGAAA